MPKKSTSPSPLSVAFAFALGCCSTLGCLHSQLIFHSRPKNQKSKTTTIVVVVDSSTLGCTACTLGCFFTLGAAFSLSAASLSAAFTSRVSQVAEGVTHSPKIKNQKQPPLWLSLILPLLAAFALAPGRCLYAHPVMAHSVVLLTQSHRSLFSATHSPKIKNQKPPPP